MKKITLFLLSFFLLTAPTYADDKKETLKQIEARVAAEKQKQAEIGTKMQSLEKDMKGLKTNLVDTADKVQKHEKNLDSLEIRISKLDAQKNNLEENLHKDKQSLAELVTALQRIRRLPPEALIARPGAPLETAQASVILGAIMPEIHQRAEKYHAQLEELKDIEENLSKNKDQLSTTAAKLKVEQKKMEALISDRQKSMLQAKSEYESQAQEVTALSRRASDMRDLIQKIEEEQARKAARAAHKVPKNKNSNEILPSKIRKNNVDERELGSSLATLGSGRLPTAGIIAIKYGQSDTLGAPSEGLHIKGRSGSLVVAPLKGVVRYAGPFKSYGSIVLVEHKNNYHSLIAGLGRIDTVVGQSVDAGEPIGTLGSSGSLYYELRYNGQPINPSRKFAD